MDHSSSDGGGDSGGDAGGTRGETVFVINSSTSIRRRLKKNPLYVATCDSEAAFTLHL